MTARGIDARQGQDAQRLDATHESPVAASDAPNKDSLMTNPSNRTDVTDAMIEAGSQAMARLSRLLGPPSQHDLEIAARDAFTAMLTAQPQSGEVEPVDQEEVRRVLAIPTNWELHWGPLNGDESDCLWQVHSVNGGRNDREWALLATGKTPLEALTTARKLGAKR